MLIHSYSSDFVTVFTPHDLSGICANPSVPQATDCVLPLADDVDAD